jgi:hypothetical protein
MAPPVARLDRFHSETDGLAAALRPRAEVGFDLWEASSTPDTTNDRVPNSLRQRVPFENSPVFEFNNIKTFGCRLAV